jgi:hypothetical protein
MKKYSAILRRFKVSGQLLVLMAIILLTSCKKEDEGFAYLEQWLGTYTGTSHHWSSYPSDTAWIENNEYKDVVVDVEKGSRDSTVLLVMTYDDASVDSVKDLKISASGRYFSEWGAGSSYGSRTVQFNDNKMHYDLFQKCGIPCSSGMDFVAEKVVSL